MYHCYAEQVYYGRDLEKESGKLLHMTGGLTIGKENTENVNNVLRSTREFHIEHEIYSVEEASKLFPQHRFEVCEIRRERLS